MVRTLRYNEPSCKTCEKRLALQCIRVFRCPLPCVCVSELVAPSIRGLCLVHMYTHKRIGGT